LLGGQGGEVIKRALATEHPTPFIQRFQREHGLAAVSQDDNGAAMLEASFCFLDLFAPRRAPTYASLVSEMADKLTDKIRQGQIAQDKSDNNPHIHRHIES
jgi:flagellar biosynthesis protein FlhB